MQRLPDASHSRAPVQCHLHARKLIHTSIPEHKVITRSCHLLHVCNVQRHAVRSYLETSHCSVPSRLPLEQCCMCSSDKDFMLGSVVGSLPENCARLSRASSQDETRAGPTRSSDALRIVSSNGAVEGGVSEDVTIPCGHRTLACTDIGRHLPIQLIKSHSGPRMPGTGSRPRASTRTQCPPTGWSAGSTMP